MRPVFAFVLGIVINVAPVAAVHAGTPASAVFAGCVQSSANCVSGTISSTGPAPISGFLAWQYSFTTTFDPQGGWVFSYAFVDPNNLLVDVSQQPFADLYDSGRDLGQPNTTSAFSGLFWAPADWLPRFFDAFTYESGRDPPGSFETGFQPTGLRVELQPGTITPEPNITALIATGLGGIGGLGVWRRRRGA